MFDRTASTNWRITTVPCVDLAVLGALARLLHGTEVSSQSRGIGAALDSHDTTRGEVHAASTHCPPSAPMAQI